MSTDGIALDSAMINEDADEVRREEYCFRPLIGEGGPRVEPPFGQRKQWI